MSNFLKNLFKKKDTELLEKQRKAMTANEFVNVSDIENHISYGKNDGLIYAYLRIMPINLELLSEKEKDSKIRSLSTELSSQTKPYGIFTIPRPVDVSKMINMLKGLKDETTDYIQRELLTEEIRELSRYALSGEINEKQFYLCIWEKSNKNGERELLKRAGELINRFSECKITANLCTDSDIIKLFNLFGNPNYAHLEDGDPTEHVPIIKR